MDGFQYHRFLKIRKFLGDVLKMYSNLAMFGNIIETFPVF